MKGDCKSELYPGKNLNIHGQYVLVLITQHFLYGHKKHSILIARQPRDGLHSGRLKLMAKPFRARSGMFFKEPAKVGVVIKMQLQTYFSYRTAIVQE